MVDYTNKLEKLHRSALPVVQRSTINDAAYKLKTTSLPKTAKATFKERQPNFFKANSRVEPAKGFDTANMAATVGMVSSGLHGPATNYAVRDLEQQEHSGTIRGRSFKPLPSARAGRGNVKANARISQIRNKIVDYRDSKGKSKLQKLLKASIHAGVGGYVLGDKTLYRITSLRRVKGSFKIKKQSLFSFEKHGTAKVRSTNFMKRAAESVVRDMEAMFKVNAEKQFRKAGVMK